MRGKELEVVDLYLKDVTVDLRLKREEEQLLFQLYEGSRTSEEVLSSFLSDEERGKKWQSHFQEWFEDEDLEMMPGRELAQKTLVTCNLPLVISIAKRYSGVNLDLDFSDMIQEGNLGLMRAVEKFDWRRGNKFSTYATPWIRKSISEALRNKGRTVRLPVHQIDRKIFINRQREDLEQELGRSVRPEDFVDVSEVMERFDLPDDRNEAVKKLSLFLTRTRQPRSLEDSVGNNGRSELKGFLARDYNLEKGVLDTVVNQSRLEKIFSGLDQCLSPREEKVIKLALMNGNLSFEKLGQKFKMSGEGVRRILRIAEWKLRFHLFFNGHENGNLSEEAVIGRANQLLENFESVDIFFFIACLGIKKTGFKKYLLEICERIGIDCQYDNGNSRFVYSSAEALKIIRGFYNHPDFKRIGHKVKKAV